MPPSSLRSRCSWLRPHGRTPAPRHAGKAPSMPPRPRWPLTRCRTSTWARACGPRHPPSYSRIHRAPHDIRRRPRLLRHGNVAAARRDDREPLPGRIVLPLRPDDPGFFVDYGVLRWLRTMPYCWGSSPRKEEVVLRTCEGRATIRWESLLPGSRRTPYKPFRRACGCRISPPRGPGRALPVSANQLVSSRSPSITPGR